jgi:transaldolase/glucose-6-phosphate isomerase
LKAEGISIESVTDELEFEGVQAFSKAFESLISAIESRSNEIISSIGSLSSKVSRRIARFEEEGVATRMWEHDASLWTKDLRDQEEIRRRMGWLDLPLTPQSHLTKINSISDQIQKDGIRKVLLLGMGGSSLAPEVLSKVFCAGEKERKEAQESIRAIVDFAILDSTDPGQVSATAMDFPPEESLYIVSSKSGGTEEVKALTEYFWQISGENGGRFIAITDPGTVLVSLANERKFRSTLMADPMVGGRFSVFTDFGLLPMRLMGIDPSKMLEAARVMMDDCQRSIPAGRNPGLVTGAVMGEAALAGRDKLTLIADPQLAAFGSWLEQLIAESTGKQGKGIIVIDGESIAEPHYYGEDRLFVHLKIKKEAAPAIEALKLAGHPVLEFVIPDVYALSREFYRWEIATAVACHILGINAFDQPDVQDNKGRTKNKIEIFQSKGLLEEVNPKWEGEGIKVFTNQDIEIIGWKSSLKFFVNLARPGDYIAINAYLPRNGEMIDALMKLRVRIGDMTGVATTIGFGPRFLHSTGQLHKGGPKSSLFIQITADPEKDLEIPMKGSRFTFGMLQRAQAIGDYEALEARGRRILRLHLSTPDEIYRIANDFQTET